MGSIQVARGRTVAFGVAIVAAASVLGGCAGASKAASPGTPTAGASASSVEVQTPATQPSRSGQPPATPTAAPATEVNPPGDIPDNQVFVPYSPAGSTLRVSVPEGWSRSTKGGVVTFTDKLNSVTIQLVKATAPPTVASARAREVPQLARSVAAYKAGDVTSAQRKGGDCVKITYEQDSAADAVTTKVVRDAVERYEFWKGGTEAVVTLSGPVNADNVDPWRIISDSVAWS